MTDGQISFNEDIDAERQIQEAQARIKALDEEFKICTRIDLNDAKLALEAARSKSNDRRPEIQKIFSLAHNIKGQGSTFGNEMMTLVGKSLCDFIRHIPDATDWELLVIHRHLTAMTTIINKEVKVPDGPLAEEIMARLKQDITLALYAAPVFGSQTPSDNKDGIFYFGAIIIY